MRPRSIILNRDNNHPNHPNIKIRINGNYFTRVSHYFIHYSRNVESFISNVLLSILIINNNLNNLDLSNLRLLRNIGLQ